MGIKESKILKAKIAAQKTKIDILNAENVSMTTQIENLTTIANIKSGISQADSENVGNSDTEIMTLKNQIASYDEITAAL